MAEGQVLNGSRLEDLLAGKKIVMTGVTGFIGEQLLWKILTDLPGTTAGVLVRPKGPRSATDRVRSLLEKPIFDEVRNAAGGVEALLEDRVQVIEGDLPNVPKLPRDMDVLVHCAGDVSFDPPIDRAFQTNVVGTRALMTRLRESCSDAEGNLERVPHYVHISTAYTAGRRRGHILENAHANDVDYNVEAEAAETMARRIEADSRTPAKLAELRRRSERDHGKAGYLTTAEHTEKLRQEWVADKLIEAGTERARSLGWTDVYTFAKTMGENIVADLGRDMRVSIVRPAIVESSLRYPHPGWIEGFKMAEPIILAYGKGNLPEFPASPDSVIDIVPCDHVVNAILAVCATEPEVGDPEFYHVASGSRNPLTFRRLYELVRGYFAEHPFEKPGSGAVSLPVWNFPGWARVERLLATSEVASRGADRLLAFAPRGRRTRQIVSEVDKSRKKLDFLRRYFKIYMEYLRSELHFVDDHTLALHRSLHPDDVAAFAFDTSEVDWYEYIVEIHCPSITEPVRRNDRRKAQAPPTFRDPSENTADPSTVVAVFDLDGTVMSGNVVETYLWTRLPELNGRGRLRELGSIIGKLPEYLRAEHTERGTFLRAFYRRYAGADLAELERVIDEEITPHILERVSSDAIRRIRAHREAGHRTILMTGAIRPLTRPLAPLFDEIVAAELLTDEDGRCTGFLSSPPMVGESRPAWLRHYAEVHGVDLSASYAYGDSHVDLPMLSVVGHPVAVNPDRGLLRATHAYKWSVVDWEASPQMPRWTLPRTKEN